MLLGCLSSTSRAENEVGQSMTETQSKQMALCLHPLPGISSQAVNSSGGEGKKKSETSLFPSVSEAASAAAAAVSSLSPQMLPNIIISYLSSNPIMQLSETKSVAALYVSLTLS